MFVMLEGFVEEQKEEEDRFAFECEKFSDRGER